MKKIINGKLYNTETATFCGSFSAHCGSFNYVSEELYKKRTGEFFLYGEGGPMSRYAKSCGDNSWSGSDGITPMTEQEARKWAERHLDADDYIEIFGEPEE